MRKLIIISVMLFVVGCSSSVNMYHPKHGRVGMDNKYLDADMTYCTNKVRKSQYKNMDVWAEKMASCLMKKGWRA